MLKLLDAIGWIVIVIGILLETYAEGRVSDIDAGLRAHESGIVTAAEGQATHAVSGAEEANRQAGKASDKAIEAQEQTAKAVLEQERLKKVNLVLQSQVEVEKTERLRLEEKYGPRTLSASQRAYLIADLKIAIKKQTAPVDVRVSFLAIDGDFFGQQIVDAINEPSTGWKANLTHILITGSEKGAYIAIGGYVVPPAVYSFQKALSAAGVSTTIGVDSELHGGAWYFVICPKN